MARTIITLLAGVAAALVLAGTLTGQWWSHSVDEDRSVMGLREATLCRGSGCATVPLEMVERKVPWLRAGAAAHTAGLLAGGLFLILGASTLAGKRYRLLCLTALSASAAALGTGAAFLFSTPEYTGMGMGASAFVYFVGVILGSTAAIIQMRQIRALAGNSNAAQVS